MEKARLALIGANGMLAQMIREKTPGSVEIIPYDLPDFDLADQQQVMAELSRLQPTVIINCAAYTNVDGCESEEALALRVNGHGPGILAEAACTVGAILVHISTDYVFSGSKRTPYHEGDQTGPLSAYGRSKLAGEEVILRSGLQRYYILRTSWLYGPGGKNFVETILRLAYEREELRVVADQVGTPTYTADLAQAIFNLLAVPDGDPAPYGIYHFSNLGECSWYRFAEEIVTLSREGGLPLKTVRVLPISTEEYPLPATRPAYSVFSKEKYLAATGAEIPQWQESLKHYLQERNQNRGQ